ncbi:MAG TPA: DUF433 domain-containing protein [Nitrospirae bacterium]|nr:DUF433 domain-containing protein [Nitrospirota bacterium]HDZ03169.1 DUF433 domain-containing protein [Nitrospirota bacterium]
MQETRLDPLPQIIAGTGIKVLDVAIRYEVMGMSPEDIIVALPHLNLSQIHDALSYYYEHKSEIDQDWRNALKKTATANGEFVLNGRLEKSRALR